MPLSVEQQILSENVRNAQEFMKWIGVITSGFDKEFKNKPKQERETEKKALFQKFIELKLTPEIAWDVLIHEHELCSNLQQYVSEVDDHNLVSFLIKKANEKEHFPNDYLQLIRPLIFLYQRNNCKDAVIKIVYQLLHIPNFRKAFQEDHSLAPFFMRGFYETLAKYVHENCSDPTLKSSLLEVCNPKQPASHLIDNELAKAFGYNQPLTAEQEDVLAIQKFLADLSDGSPLMKHLQQLEHALQTAAGERYNSQTQTLLGYVEGQAHKQHKFFSEFLRNWARENGFHGIGKLKGFLDTNQFFAFIAKGGIFTDPGVRSDSHGEFTHAIQWYLITKWNNENPTEKKLKCHPTHLLAFLGTEYDKHNEWNRTFEGSLASLYAPTDTDFRKVFNVNSYLLATDCKFPVLHQLCRGRTLKGPRASKQNEPPTEFKEFTSAPKR